MTSLLSPLALQLVNTNYIETPDNELFRYMIDLTALYTAFQYSMSKENYSEEFMRVYFKLFIENAVVLRSDEGYRTGYDMEIIIYNVTTDFDVATDFDIDQVRHIGNNYENMLHDLVIALYTIIETIKEPNTKVIPFVWEENTAIIKLVLLYNSNLDLDILYP